MQGGFIVCNCCKKGSGEGFEGDIFTQKGPSFFVEVLFGVS